ncbi:MAG: GntP family permease [Acidobacteriota bacterium]|nr:MAG: GntP family permease [Acidobacteriota bacterium]
MIGPVGTLLLGVGLILVFLLYFKLHPFLALILSALTCAFFSDAIPVENVVPTVAGGFADLMGKIGILLVLASIVGKCLVDSGAADRIIRTFSRWFGSGREQYSFLSSGFLLSMPVFFDTVFYLLAPLVRAAYARRKRDYALMICAAAAGGAITHALVPPTPGPVVVAQTLNVSLGLAVLVGTLVSIVPALVGGVWYAKFLNKRLDIKPLPVYGLSNEEMEELAKRPDEELPSFLSSLIPIALPVGLISLSTIVGIGALEGRVAQVIEFLGDKDIAFTLGAATAIWLVVSVRKIRLQELFKSLEPAISSGATIAFITCSGGAFGKVLTDSGVGDVIADAAAKWGLSYLTLAFLIAALIRVAQGSATVAMITSAGIIAPAIAAVELPYHPVYLVGVIGFGATTTPWMNDSGFWIVCKMAGLTEGETLKVWTLLLTVISFTGFLWVHFLAKVLPLV